MVKLLKSPRAILTDFGEDGIALGKANDSKQQIKTIKNCLNLLEQNSPIIQKQSS